MWDQKFDEYWKLIQIGKPLIVGYYYDNIAILASAEASTQLQFNAGFSKDLDSDD